MFQLPDPLHPALVHFPIAVAVMLPLAAAGVAIAIAAGWLDRRSWVLVVALHAFGAGMAWWAVDAGHDQAERVVKAVPGIKRFVHEHAEHGEQLAWGFTGTWILTAAGLLGGTAGRRARVLAVIGAAVVAGLAVPTGESGGALVYRHGAASAYTEHAAGAAQGVPAPAAGGTPEAP
jgi:hypothetical protein